MKKRSPGQKVEVCKRDGRNRIYTASALFANRRPLWSLRFRSVL